MKISIDISLENVIETLREHGWIISGPKKERNNIECDPEFLDIYDATNPKKKDECYLLYQYDEDVVLEMAGDGYTPIESMKDLLERINVDWD